jgi:hypothetical protein
MSSAPIGLIQHLIVMANPRFNGVELGAKLLKQLLSKLLPTARHNLLEI